MAGFSFDTDPFDTFGFGGRRRTAQFPALPEPEARSAIGSLTDNALSGLGYVGSLLDKVTGARAIRGTLGGNPRELLSVLPFSDSFHLTDPTQITSGETLLENAGIIGPNDPSAWEARDFLGPAAEIALDPATYFGGIGALTKLGKAAQKGGTLTKGLLPAVQAGQRSIHPLMAGFSPATQAAAGALPGKLLGGLNVGVRKIPGAAAVEDYAAKLGGAAKVGARALFDPLAGPYPNATTQAAHEAAFLPKRRDVLEGVKGPVFDRYQDVQALHDKGVDPGELDRYLLQKVEGVEPGLRIGGAPGPHLGTLGPHLGEIDPIADRLRSQYQQVRADELAMGNKSPGLDSLWGLDYGLRQVSKAPGSEPAGLLAKLFDTSNASQRRRQAIFDLPGGTAQLQDVIRDPAFSLAARNPAGRQVVSSKVWDLLTEPFGGANAVGPLTPVAPEFLARMEKVRRGLPAYLAKVPDEMIDIPGRATPAVPFFKPDVIANQLLRGERSANVQGGAAGVYDTIKRANQQAAGPGLTPVLRVLNKAGLRGEPAYEHALRAVGLDPAAVLANAGTIPLAPVSPKSAYRKALGPFGIPEAAAKGATSLMTRFATPVEAGPVLKALDSGLALGKDWLYTLFPPSHVRNVYSGAYEAGVEAGVRPTNPAYVDYGKALAGAGLVTGIPGHAPLSPDAQRLAFLRELYVKGIVDPVHPQGELAQAVGVRVPDPASANPARPLAGRAGVMEVLKDWANVRGALADPLGSRGVSGRVLDPFDLAGQGPRQVDTNPMVRAGRAVGKVSENWLRGSQQLALRRQGWTADAARDAVMRTHLDYVEGLSDFEKNVMRRLIPFYTFSRLNIPKQVRRAVERPATVQTPIRLAAGTKDESTYTPSYLSSGLAIPLGTGVNDDGSPSTRFLTQVGLPFEEAFGHLKVGRNPVDTATKTLTNLAASLRGIVKHPLEAISGKQFYTGRELKDLRPGNLATGFGLLDDDTARPLAQLLANSPVTRMATTLQKLTDPRKWQDPFALPVSLGTGARLTDVDTQKWRAVDARQRVEELLDVMPHIAESRDFYARPDQKPQLTDEEVGLLRLQAYIKEKARAAAKEKRRVGVFGG